jgi:DDE superfamily endonuclease
VRRLKQLPAEAVLLFEDETGLRLFPLLRRAWGLRGEPLRIGITGRKAKRVLFGALNPRTGHRLLQQAPKMKQIHFQSFLHLLRRAYRERPSWLLLDEAPCHIAPRSQTRARQLTLELLWLPKQCSELNAMAQVWRERKGKISANYQHPTMEAHGTFAQAWLMSLTATEAKRKAGILSKNFWLQSFFK